MSHVSFVWSSDEAASISLTLAADRELGGRRPIAIVSVSRRGTVVACAERKIGVSSPMNIVERAWRGAHQPEVSKHPVMVDDWAESLVELDRAQSRRRHPSNREPAWAKDGGYDSAEWEF